MRETEREIVFVCLVALLQRGCRGGGVVCLSRPVSQIGGGGVFVILYNIYKAVSCQFSILVG